MSDRAGVYESQRYELRMTNRWMCHACGERYEKAPPGLVCICGERKVSITCEHGKRGSECSACRREVRR